MSKYPQQKSGLILLVVLSMLTLFSLLSITYVVFSSQSRTSSMGMARRDHHRMEQSRLLDYSLQQVLRGSKTGSLSSIAQHSLLADVYGHRQSLIATNTVSKARYTTGSDRAEFFASRFLRIPLDTTLGASGITPPNEHDLLTGRVLTFLEGPLRNVSFRIVRSLGTVTAVPDLSYSVVVDLMEASKSKSNSLSAWISGGATTLCQNATTNTGYAIRINDQETNGFGFGINSDGTNVQVSGQNENLTESFLARYAATAGDTDESYDAADFNDQWLAYRRSGASAAEDILPSFHRAALINYIVESVPDYGNTTNFTQPMFLDLLNKIQLACPRPLGISVRNLEPPATDYASSNRDFSGSNTGTPTLDINLGSKWSNWTVAGAGGKSPKDSFLEFAKFLTTGPWDVDNDGDGLADSVWVDLDLPLMTSPEGKLLKMLTAYYIVDLDSKLDLNAVGNLHQTTAANYNPTTSNALTTAGLGLPQGFGTGPADSSLRHLFATDTDYLNFLEARYGGTNGTPGEGLSTAVTNLVDDVRSRLDGGGNVFNPAFPVSALNPENTGTRERRQTVQHNQLPGLPIGIRGAEALGFDRLGNPLLARGTSTTIANQGLDDPYEFRLLETAHSDLPFSIADWERTYRKYDWDVSMLPRRLKPYALLETYANAVAPRTAHMRNVPLAAQSTVTADPIDSLYELIVQIGQRRNTVLPATGFTLTGDMFNELFPFEFGRGTAMDLNRPFGNGIDDDMDGQIDEPEELLKNRFDDNANGTVDEIGEQTLAHRQGSVYISNGVAQVNSAAGENPTFGYGYAINDNLDPQYEAIVSGSPIIARDHHGQQSRQLLARNLYCLGMLLLPDQLNFSNRPGTAPLVGPDRARAIAQWAVNVVDFRDADHAMTRFPYDPDPFQPVVISSTLTKYWVPNADAAGLPIGAVVWGMEQPELLITESIATHDLRVKDTEDDDGNGKTTTAAVNADDDYDQYRIPEGSLFLEFYCPRTTSIQSDNAVPGVSAGSTDGMYRIGATNLELNLSALSPSDGTTRYPVWRVAITAPNPGVAPASGKDITHQFALDPPPPAVPPVPRIPTPADYNGLRFDFTRTIPEAPVIDRILWFANTSGFTAAQVAAAATGLPATVSATDAPAHVYSKTSAGPIGIEGGQYLVIGPRQVTYFGSKTNSGVSHLNEPNNHRIVLENATISAASTPPGAQSWATIFTAANAPAPAIKRPIMRDVVPIILGTNPPWSGAGLPTTVGVNVSEPHPTSADYYPAPTKQLNSTDATGDPVNGAVGFKFLPQDSYYDYGVSPAVKTLPNHPFDAKATAPIKKFETAGHAPQGKTGVANPGTQENWCTAYLQRLADPERPWHDVFNPYITVDLIPIDLTVFSGEETTPSPAPGYRFATRQKNGQTRNSAGVTSLRGLTFLSYETDPLPAVVTPPPSALNYFGAELPVDDGTFTRANSKLSAVNNFTTLGYLNSPYELLNDIPPTIVVPGNYLGAPKVAPKSVTWFNRPFASPHELMLVPVCAPGQLMQEFHVPLSPTVSPPLASTDVAAINHYSTLQGNVFSHLPNFFQPSEPVPPVVPPAPPKVNFAASTLFELVTTPSPWSDADSLVPPADFTPSNPREVAAIGLLMPPFNRVSKMVERGRLNINTVSEEAAWQGVEWNYMNQTGRSTIGSTNYWMRLLQSRMGYTPAAGQVGGNAQLNPNYPTEFLGVFKSQFAVGVAPTIRTGYTLDTGVLSAATLLRNNGMNPLFNIRTDVGGTNAAQAFNEYLPITRLANLTTNRSNVFAVHMTIGYFEYDPSTGMSQEYGWDNGKTRRHRGFYVIDRSIPVAFEPGIDHNTENCVLMRRIIE